MDKLAKLSNMVLKQQVKVLHNLSGMAVDKQYILTAKPGNVASPVQRNYSIDWDKECQTIFVKEKSPSTPTDVWGVMVPMQEVQKKRVHWEDLGELGENTLLDTFEATEETWRDPITTRVNICNLPGVQNVNYV